VDAYKLAGVNHRVDVFGGVLADQCAELLRDFFGQRRS
jgi:tRNA(Arg) A34 adenosine deaminase TadA